MDKIKSDFIRKWSSWFVLRRNNKILLEAFERELNEVIENELQNLNTNKANRKLNG